MPNEIAERFELLIQEGDLLLEGKGNTTEPDWTARCTNAIMACYGMKSEEFRAFRWTSSMNQKIEVLNMFVAKERGKQSYLEKSQSPP
jgi:hypothetical protein